MYVSEISTEPVIYPTPTQPVTYPTPTTEKPYPTPTQPVTYLTPTTEKLYPTPTQPATYATPPTALQCSSNEQSVQLNYADTVQGTSELALWVILADGSTMSSDVSKALAGSGTWLTLPPSGDDDKPIRLLIRYNLHCHFSAI